jgi:hypothetical protein
MLVQTKIKKLVLVKTQDTCLDYGHETPLLYIIHHHTYSVGLAMGTRHPFSTSYTITPLPLGLVLLGNTFAFGVGFFFFFNGLEDLLRFLGT